MKKKKMKLSTLYWILTAVFVLLTAAGGVYYFVTPDMVSEMWFFVPCVIALLFSNLAVRARNEKK